MIFSKIISQVLSARGPEDIEVALLSSMMEPIKLHVDRSRLALFAGSIEDSVCGGIVCLEWSGGLLMVHFF
jgi:hypothetical protein